MAKRFTEAMLSDVLQVNGHEWDYLPRGLVWMLDPKTGSIHSPIKGKGQAAATFSRAGTPYQWVNGIMKAVAVNQPRLENGALLLEPAATNKCTKSRDFGTWSVVGTPTEAQTQIGIDGVANTAWVIGDDDAASQEVEYLGGIVIANDNATHCGSLYIKKDSDVTRFPAIRLNLTGGTAVSQVVHLNTSTGATKSEAAVTGQAESIGAWWRLPVTATNNTSGNNALAFYLYPAKGTVIGTASNAAVGTCIVDGAQIELNTKYPTSFILTAGAEASRTTEASGLTYTLPTGIFTGSKALTCVALVNLGAPEADFAANHNIIATSAAANSLIYINNSGDFATNDGTTVISKDVNLARGTWYKVAVKAQTATGKFNVGSVALGTPFTTTCWGTEQNYDGGFAVGANLILGQTLGFPMKIGLVGLWNRVLTDAEISMIG